MKSAQLECDGKPLKEVVIIVNPAEAIILEKALNAFADLYKRSKNVQKLKKEFEDVPIIFLTMKARNVHDFPVMKVRCPTCPFNEDGDKATRDMVTARLFEYSQICHHPALSDKPETHLCRGARDYQLTIFHRLGFLSEPTDEEWNKKRLEFGV